MDNSNYFFGPLTAQIYDSQLYLNNQFSWLHEIVGKTYFSNSHLLQSKLLQTFSFISEYVGFPFGVLWYF